ncbi:MAG: bifunctional DNA primase/polymerase, partial [Planctomycetota bacterium]|nr:bifunctional DNA primase/polymerase [Planctomycetota bacterium]
DEAGDHAGTVWAEIRDIAQRYGAPITLTGGGGEHIFFRRPRRLSADKLPQTIAGCKSIEVKAGPRCQVVIPPSRHWSGGVYKAASGKSAAEHLQDIADAPELPKELEALLLREMGEPAKTKTKTKTKAQGPEVEVLIDETALEEETAQEQGREAFRRWARRTWPPDGVPGRGERNNALYRMSCAAVEYGCPRDVDSVFEWVEEFIEPSGLLTEEREKSRATVASAVRREDLQRGARNPVASKRTNGELPGFGRLLPEDLAALTLTDDGRVKATDANLLLIAARDPLLARLFTEWRMCGSIYWRFRCRNPFEVHLRGFDAVAEGPIEWSKGATACALAAWFEREYGVPNAKRDTLEAVMLTIAHRGARDAGNEAVQAMLAKAAAWCRQRFGSDAPQTDEQRRECEAHVRDSMRQLALALQAERTDWAAEALRMHLLASFRRLALRPPDEVYKHDHVIVLVGPQGCGKSSAIRRLALLPPEKGGVLEVADFSRREYMDDANEHQFIVCDELASFLRAREHEDVKRFVTDLRHAVNIKYGPVVREGRRFVLWGATNSPEFLNDPTGNRRYWPIVTKATMRDPIDIPRIEALHEQLWTAIALADLLRMTSYCDQATDQGAKFAAGAAEVEQECTGGSFLEEKLAQWWEDVQAYPDRMRRLRQSGLALSDLWAQLTVAPETQELLRGTSQRGLETRLGSLLRRWGWQKQRRWNGSTGRLETVFRYYPPPEAPAPPGAPPGAPGAPPKG